MTRFESCAHEGGAEGPLTRCRKCGAVKVAGGEWRPISLPKKPCCEGCAERKRKAIAKYKREKGCHECGKYHRPERHR